MYESLPQPMEGEVCQSWVTRGANFVLVVSQAAQGCKLNRSDNPDEYMVLLPKTGALIEAGGKSLKADADSLVIVPPGPSSITSWGDGIVVRLFSSQAKDLLARATNASIYEDGAPGVAPLVLWPPPINGYRLRHYRLVEYEKNDSNFRIFRSSNLMMNVLLKHKVPRDVRSMSPHAHEDFEQGSLVLEGTYVHHLRYPWTSDMTSWKEDEHVEMASPSLLVIPPKVIHTSQYVGEGEGWLIDMFAPPRKDFSNMPGRVCNADEYPLLMD
jgi:mannose-6-phosphate isomerase-like protein (cupin superfamily)